ncbi:MAG: DUF1538 domain-containing protein [Acholeplasmataceae bacterium]|nr:DUF1538 domain-containing protein [Acholeplasmataceae bacterium]
MNKLLREKIKEAFQAVLPLTVVIIITLVILKVEFKTILNFSLGSLLLMIGLVVFNIGATQSMMELSEEIGAYITRKRSLFLLIFVGFTIGFLITVSEPSVWVLGEQFKGTVDKFVLIGFISVGVAIFLVIALLRFVFQIKLNILLVILLSILFIIAIFIPEEFVPVAFDSGGVTTGPMAVPFIISLGLGVLSTSSNYKKSEDSFGMVGISSIGPILAVFILGLIYSPKADASTIEETKNILGFIAQYLKEIGIAIIPFIIFFVFFQIFAFKFPRKRVIRIFVGFVLTYIGLVIFLVGASVGFMNIGSFLGETIAKFNSVWLLIPIGIIFGFVIVAAEPSVVVLVGQVQEVTDGVVGKKAMVLVMSIGVSLAVGLAMVRVVYDISIWYFLIPSYLIAVILSFIVPKMFTGIAFDSGGAVSGALTSTFLVPFAIGAANIIYDYNQTKILTNAFGLVAFVAMAPLVTIQLLGLIVKLKQLRKPDLVAKDKIIEFEEEG